MMDECPEQCKWKKRSEAKGVKAFPVLFSWEQRLWTKQNAVGIMHTGHQAASVRERAKSKTKLGSSAATHIPWHLSRSILCQGNPIASDWTTLFCFLLGGFTRWPNKLIPSLNDAKWVDISWGYPICKVGHCREQSRSSKMNDYWH